MKRETKKEKVYQLTGDRVNKLLELNGLSQADLCRMLPGDTEDGHVNRQYLNGIVNGYRKLTPALAKKILAVFPGNGYRLSWLLGYDDFMTDRDQALSSFEQLEKEVGEAFDNQRTICASVADMMKIYGMNWDGIPINRKLQTPGKHIVTCQGAQFEPWELARIANKVYQFLQMELDYAIETKRIQGTQEEC